MINASSKLTRSALSRAKRITEKTLQLYTLRICRREYEAQEFYRLNERPIEFSFLFRQLSSLYPRKVLDVGTGTTSLPHLLRHCGFLVTAVDNIKDYWPSGLVNRHFHVLNDDITKTKLDGSFDAVTCISVLEHIERSDDAVSNMLRLLRPGGHLIMTFPFNEGQYVRNVYDLPESSYGQGNPYITQSFSRRELNGWLTRDAALVEQEYWQCWTGSHWTEGRQVIPPKQVSQTEIHQLSCVLIRKN